jgi:hypothetical protein
VSILETPIGFFTLYEAVDAVGRARFGSAWEYAVLIDNPKGGAHGEVTTMIAEGCEDGRIFAAYRSINGADNLDHGVWRARHWWTYFMTATIDLDLPLLDDRGKPVSDGRSARCTREIFVRRDSLQQFIASLGPAAIAEPALGPASVETIRTHIRAVYIDPEGGRPNVNELAKIVRPRLNAKGVDASEREIIRIGGEEEFRRSRRKPGTTKASELRKK